MLSSFQIDISIWSLADLWAIYSKMFLTVTMRPFSWKYLTRGMAFCLKLVKRRSIALGLSSGRPCCSARFSKRSFRRWLEQARNTTRSGVQIYRGKKGGECLLTIMSQFKLILWYSHLLAVKIKAICGSVICEDVAIKNHSKVTRLTHLQVRLPGPSYYNEWDWMWTTGK